MKGTVMITGQTRFEKLVYTICTKILVFRIQHNI